MNGTVSTSDTVTVITFISLIIAHAQFETHPKKELSKYVHYSR